jgi:hypothetical protein
MALKRKMIKNLGIGLPSATVPLAPDVIISDSTPTTRDVAERGQVVVTDANTVHIYAGKLNGASVWKEVAGKVINTDILDINATGVVTVDGASISLDATTASNLTVTGAGADLTVSSVGGSVLVQSSEASATAIKLETTDAASGVVVDTGSAGVSLTTTGGIIDLNSTTGAVTMSPLVDTQAAAAVTINAHVGVGTFTGLTTAAAATEVLTVTNSVCTATSAILCTLSSLGAEDAQLTIQRVNPGVGSFTVTYKNNGANALASDVMLTFWLLRA